MSRDSPLLDTNAILRHILQDHPDHSPRASALFARLDAQELTVRILDQAFFEVAFTMGRSYKATRSEIRDAILQLIELPAVLVRNKDAWRSAFDVFLKYGTLSLVDAFHVVTAARLGITEIISFDTDFDAIPNITRIEP